MKRRTILLLALALLAACGRPADAPDQEAQYQVTEQEGSVDPEHGRETWFAIGPVNGVNGNAANGVAQAYLYEDGQSVIVGQVNIEPPPPGFHYEGWLLGVNGDIVSAGKFENPFGDVRHLLRFAIPQDIRQYPKFLVTLELGDDPKSGETVAEAVLTHRER